MATLLVIAALAVTPLLAQAQVVSPYTVVALRGGSPIQFLPLTATDGIFVLSGEPTTSCPLTSGCPAGDETVFTGGDGTLNLAVEVSGGQQVYVQSDGALGFTAAGDPTIPPGATVSAFSYLEGTNLGDLGVTGGFLACTTDAALYQVFAGLPGVDTTGCIGFDTGTENYTAGVYGAYQYD